MLAERESGIKTLYTFNQTKRTGQPRPFCLINFCGFFRLIKYLKNSVLEE